MSRFGSKAWRGVLIGLIMGGGVWIAWSLDLLDSWEATTWTWRARYFTQREVPSPQVKLILIDQDSLDWGQKVNDFGWPWPREVYAAILGFCARGGAKAVALDILFSEPSVLGVSDDNALGEALASGSPTVLTAMPGGPHEIWPDEVPRPEWKLSIPVPVKSRMMFPVREIVSQCAAVGHVWGDSDADGVYRRMRPFCRFDGVDIPALGLATWLVNDGGGHELAARPGQLRLGDKIIPLDRQGQVILRFRGKAGMPQVVSAAAVIQSELRLQEGETPTIAPETFKDCYVLLGGLAPGLLDLRPVPVNRIYPGVALHGTFVDNLITNSLMAEVPRGLVIVGALITAIAAALSLTYGGRWRQAIPLVAFWLTLPLLVGFVAYAYGWCWPIMPQATAAGLAMVGAVAVNYSIEGRQKAFIKQAFRFYLSGPMIDKILLDPDHLKLGGEKRELTMMFTDLAGFSTFSERLSPEELTALLNEYLTEMTDIIMDEGGTLDKYEGDAIIAFWNAPLTQADHAMRACRAALRCQQRLLTCRADYEERFGATLTMRIGINTGDVVVGNMGSRTRFNYTILGDAANLAARLEGANKAFGTHTMVSESTWDQVSAAFQARKLANLRVVGRKNAVGVYELTGLVTDAVPDAWGRFANGLALFGSGDFGAAKEIFEQLPDDPAARAYVQRCERLISSAPQQWDGVWTLTEK